MEENKDLQNQENENTESKQEKKESIFDSHKKEKIRRQFGNITIYNMTEEQNKDFIEKLKNQNLSVNDNLEVMGELSLSLFKYMLQHFTSLGNEIKDRTDEEIQEWFTRDIDTKRTFRELKRMIDESIEEMQFEYETNINFITQILSMQGTKQQVENLQSLVQDTNKKIYKKQQKKNKIKPQYHGKKNQTSRIHKK